MSTQKIGDRSKGSTAEWRAQRVRPGSAPNLAQTSIDGAQLIANKKTAAILLRKYRRTIDELLGVLAIEARHSLLVILQGVDASGKDGAVRNVFTGINPQHCRIVSFKEPSAEELSHDFLWRIYRALPERGQLGVFNRSQYEDILVPYSRGSLTVKGANVRLRQVNDIERVWTETGTSVVKIFLHIGRDEQADRFQARIDDPAKHWKVKSSDFEDRRLWGRFQEIYGKVLHQTSTSYAPWYLVPSDHKWYRDVAIAGIVLSKMQELNPQLPMPEIDSEAQELE